MRSDPVRRRTLVALLASLSALLVALTVWALVVNYAQPADTPQDKIESDPKPTQPVAKKRQEEIVVPIKKLPPPIKEHDLLYDSPEALRRYHSGHFRQKMAAIWDPHPEYEFTAFNKTFHLALQLAPSFVMPNLQVTHVWNNMSIQEDPGLKTDGCFYTGTVLGDPKSSIAVNLCHGMTGHIRTSSGSYFIEPAEPYKDYATPIKHTVFGLGAMGYQEHQCHDDHEENEEKVQITREETEKSSRSKRSLSQEYYIELMVVADRKMAEYHGDELKSYVLTLMTIVTQIFKDASIGNSMSISVVKLYVLKDVDLVGGHHFKNGISASDMLKRFCDWQYLRNENNESSPNHHDTALLLTRENICRDPSKEACDTLGLAEVGTMCKFSSCSLVRDNGLSAAFTIAHELGHVLNMPHDEDVKCQNSGESTNLHHIMSRILGSNTNPWSWSNCSRHFLTEYLDAGYGSCLLDPPTLDFLDERREKGQLPGEDFTDSRQCELVYGKDSRACSYMPVCKRLACTKEVDGKEYCLTQHMPWADGTPCGQYRGNIALWCHRGECVPRDRRALLPINGGWGHWQPYGECSRTCGGGVKQAIRNCDNPRPANGGRYCVGKRLKYKSCSTKECPLGSTDFREQQCAEFNNQNITIQGIPAEKKWVPKYGGIAPEDRCKLYCSVSGSNYYSLLRDKVIDGTVCGPDTYDICVNGVCNPAGCDHVLNSTTELDFCGQCGGNNSTCQLVSGSYDQSQYGYSRVVRIPAASSNVDIRQTGHMNSNKDDNYLALIDSETGEFILNGNYYVSMFRKVILYGKTTLEYTGSDATVERINSTRPLTKDLIVMVLSVGNLYPPNIIYQYTIQKSTLAQYSWELSDEWSYCDKVCNGESRKDVICVRVEGGERVAPEMCKGLEKPESPARPCNQHCVLKWEVTSQSECSSHCGAGIRTLTVQCVQAVTIPKQRKTPIDNSSCAHLPKPPTTEPCVGPCDEARWNFTQWGPCSKTCGEGVQRRNAFCVDELNRPRNDSDCRQSEKKIERVCSLQKCPQWGFGEWTPCSVTCGSGHRRRPYWCHEEYLIVSSTHCSNQPLPQHLTVETCTLDPCPTWKTLEWSPCSVSCGVGEEVRVVECSVPGGCSPSTKPPTVRSCVLSPCSLRHENALPDIDNSAVENFTWKPKPWGSCSVTCGEGVRWRDAECYDKRNGKITDPRECLSHAIAIKKLEKCFVGNCPSWKVGQWGPCSAICDQGIESREVRCIGPHNKEVDQRYCDAEKPEAERVCMSANRCHGPKHSWRTSPWSQCSVSCGGGYRTRKVICDSGHCIDPRPSSTEPCNSNPCAKGFWKYGNWSQCSTTCGAGSRFRHVRCQNIQGHDLPEELCNYEAKPKHMQPCHQNPPCSNYIMYDWQHNRHWTPCSVTCGRGYQTRVVHCYGHRGPGQGAALVVDNSYCSNSSKPETKQPCFYQPCSKNTEKYHWVPGNWQKCSEKCSKAAKQIRKLFCYNGSVKVRKINCPKASRPERRKKCHLHNCNSCSEIQRNTNIRKDSEYMLEIGGKSVSIYCHHMNTANPVEFLTLHAVRENYAEVYDKRLIDADTCPYGVGRADLCNRCIRNAQSNVGFTAFKKIRLNISTLTVDGHDWSFANVVRGARVPYGESGDCYSKAACPQGQFSINLEKTGFRVSHKQVWHKYGQHVTVNIHKFNDNIKVVGICGGYCGMCKPHRGLKLDVLPP